MRVLFLIVARGGSRGVKNKNLRHIGKLSLLGYKAITAQKSRFCTRLILSTESAEIQQEGRKYGVEIPFTRPAELASDTASSIEVIHHAMDWIEQEGKESYDALMLLEPSSPFATAQDYDNAIELMESRKANVVVGMRETEVHSTFVGEMDEDHRITQIIDQIGRREALHRQAFNKEYTMNGGLYLFRWDHFRKTGKIYSDRENSYGYVMDRYRSVEIDEPVDLTWAQMLIEQRIIDPAPYEAVFGGNQQ